MSLSKDWFSNSRWGDAEEHAFFRRLRRARLKGHYVRLKAGALAGAGDEVRLRAAIELLQKAMADWPDPYRVSLDHHDLARWHERVGELDPAVDHYRRSLKLQEKRGCANTDAYVDFLLLFLRRAPELREEARRLIETRPFEMKNGSYMERFVLRAARAILRYEEGDKAGAGVDAAWALNAASRQHSGIHRYPELGLVRGVDDILERVRRISGESETPP